MLEIFLIALREAMQCAFILWIVLILPGIKDNRALSNCLISGVLAGFVLGLPLGYISNGSKNLPDNETWISLRYLWQWAILYSGMAVVAIRVSPPRYAVCAGLFIFGSLIFFFEARAMGFLMHEAVMEGSGIYGVAGAGMIGAAVGFSPLIFLRGLFKKPFFERLMTLPGILVLIGALKFFTGGVSELEQGNILTGLQGGLIFFLENSLRHMQSFLVIESHPFIDAPFEGLAAFLSGDRPAMALTVILLMCPSLFALINLFAKAEPQVNDISIGAERRLKITLFRKELLYKAVPVLFSFLMLLILIHTVNLSMNPLYEPVPMPVKQGDDPNAIMIPIADSLGDLTDGRLRKYVYYYGDKQVIFLAILKPDGSLGVALDECEVCRPAEWNKSAQGYAQQGDNLICKYCMTPIAISTVNSPGGCNPIPFPFSIKDKQIVIPLYDLIRTYRAVEAIGKKGSHL